MSRRAVAAEVESNLQGAPGRSVDGWKRPFLRRLEREPLEIAARAAPINDSGSDRTIPVDEDSHPYFDVSPDGSARMPGDFGGHLMDRRGRGGRAAPAGVCRRHGSARRAPLRCRGSGVARSL